MTEMTSDNSNNSSLMVTVDSKDSEDSKDSKCRVLENNDVMSLILQYSGSANVIATTSLVCHDMDTVMKPLRNFIRQFKWNKKIHSGLAIYGNKSDKNVRIFDGMLSSSGDRILTTDSNSVVKLFHTYTGECLLIVNMIKPVDNLNRFNTFSQAVNWAATFSPNGKRFTTYTNEWSHEHKRSEYKLFVFNTYTFEKEIEIQLPIDYFNFKGTWSSDGTQLIVVTQKDLTTFTFDAQSGLLLNKVRQKRWGSICQHEMESNVKINGNISKDGTRFVSGICFYIGGSYYITIWNTFTGEYIDIPHDSHEGSFCSTAFSDDSKLLAIGGFFGEIRLYDVETAKRILTLVTSDNLLTRDKIIRGIAFSPDKKLIVSASDTVIINFMSNEPIKSIIRLWSTENGDLLHVFEGHSNFISSSSFSSDGKCILTTSADKTTRLWQIPDMW
jgi:WD40 repeat protein